MNYIANTTLAVGSTLAALAIGAAVFVGSGIYNMGADDHHTALVLAIIERLRDRSITVRSSAILVPELEDASSVQAGGARYAALCVGCHLAPGVSKSDLRPGLYPHPPDLAQGEVVNAQRAFWIIKHGIKMSAMPAWGKSLDDATIWDIVAFVRGLPAMTPEQYRRLAQGSRESSTIEP
jgi:mono/diheme cytochrome c family protein